MSSEPSLRPADPAYLRLQAALVAAGVATFAQLYTTQPVLPDLAAGYGVGQGAATLSVSLATLGLAVSVLPWSLWSDRWGRRRTIVLALAAATAAGVVHPVVPSFPLHLAVRFVEGAALGGVPGAALAFVAERVAGTWVAVAAATYLAGTTVGGLTGRVLCGLVAQDFGWRWGCFAVGLVSAAALLVFALLAPRGERSRPAGAEPPLPADRDGTAVTRGDGRAGSEGGRDGPGTDVPSGLVPRIRQAWRCPGVPAVCLLAFLLMGGFVAVYNAISFRLEAPPYALPPALVGAVFVTYLAGTVSARLAGRATLRVPRRTVLLAGIAVMGAGLLGTWAGPLWAVVTGLLVFTFGFFAAHSIAAGWAPVLAPAAAAQAASLYTLAYYAGSSVLGWLVGWVYEVVGWPGVVAAVGVLVLAGAATAGRLPRPAANG